MGKLTKVVFTKKALDHETLRVNPRKGQINLGARVVRYRDKDTRQIILFIPSLDITGYGATFEKAREMLNFSITEFFNYLVKLSQKNLELELSKLGWKKDTFANKKYSNVFVSSDGELNNFNAVADDIEHLTLQV